MHLKAATGDYFASENTYQRFLISVSRMEVRRWMVFPEHPDDNAVETTQLRHEVVRFAIAEINPPETCVSIPNKENRRKVQSRYPI